MFFSPSVAMYVVDLSKVTGREWEQYAELESLGLTTGAQRSTRLGEQSLTANN